MPPTLPLSRQDCCRLFLKTLCCTSILFSNISDHWNLISTLWTNIMWHRLEWLAHPLQAGALLHHQLSAAAEGVSGFIAVRGKTRIHCVFLIFFYSAFFLGTKLGSWVLTRLQKMWDRIMASRRHSRGSLVKPVSSITCPPQTLDLLCFNQAM